MIRRAGKPILKLSAMPAPSPSATEPKRKCRELNFNTEECILSVGHCGSHEFPKREKEICRKLVPGVNAMCQLPLPCKIHAENRKELMKINVNGTDHNWPDSKPLYYEDVLKLAGEREGASVVCKPADKRLAGFTLIRGQSCPPTEGMKINCIMTGNA